MMTRRWPCPQRWAVILSLALSWLLCLAIALTEPVDRDEHMYLAAAHFVGEARLYDEVAFFQPPYAAWLHAGWQALMPGDMVLLSARLLKVVLAAALILILFRLLRRLGAAPPLAAVLVLLLLHIDPLREVVGLARNYDPPQLAILGALLLLPLRSGDREGRGRLAAAGLLAGLAVGFKLTFAAPAALVVAWPLVAPGTLATGRRGLIWTAAGALLGLLPLGMELLTGDRAALRFDLIDYHLLNARWHEREGIGAGLGPAGTLREADRLYRHTDLASLLTLAAAAVGLVSTRGRASSTTAWRLAWLMVAAGAIMILVPRPVQHGYYVPLLLALALLVAVAAGRLEGRPRTALTGLAVAACLVSVIHRGGEDLRRVRGLGQPATWPAVRLHEAGRTLAGLTAAAPARPVATTHPLYALEAGLPLERRFATGVFAWRLDDMLDPEAEARFQLVTPRGLPALMTARPASAVVVVADAPWDQPLADWARQAGWRSTPLAEGVLALLPPVTPSHSPAAEQ
jgi:hypothetical protein